MRRRRFIRRWAPWLRINFSFLLLVSYVKFCTYGLYEIPVHRLGTLVLLVTLASYNAQFYCFMVSSLCPFFGLYLIPLRSSEAASTSMYAIYDQEIKSPQSRMDVDCDFQRDKYITFDKIPWLCHCILRPQQLSIRSSSASSRELSTSFIPCLEGNFTYLTGKTPISFSDIPSKGH